MSDTVYTVLLAFVLGGIVAYAVGTNDYGIISFTAGAFAGSLTAARFERLDLGTAPFWTLAVGLAVVGTGLAALGVLPRILGFFVFAAGVFVAIQMLFFRYGGARGKRVD